MHPLLLFSVSPVSPGSCPLCAPYYALLVNEQALAPPLIPLKSATYLGSFIAPTSSSIPDVLFRCSQASTAFKQVKPFFSHFLISPKKKPQI